MADADGEGASARVLQAVLQSFHQNLLARGEISLPVTVITLHFWCRPFCSYRATRIYASDPEIMPIASDLFFFFSKKVHLSPSLSLHSKWTRR